MSFQFKQFKVNDEHCAMKVGTDGVLLGAWANGTCTRALDIGTGSGLIALMLAQRFPEAQIIGIDIDAIAVEQAQDNFAASPWPNRLTASCVALQAFQDAPFDLIVSNPPYFQNSLKAPDTQRSQARHTDTLSYAQLIEHAARLLTPNGCLTLILPIEAEREIIGLAASVNLYPNNICRVRGHEHKPFKRIMIHFTHEVCSLPAEDTLTLANSQNQRSDAYAYLTRDFYL